MPGPTAAANTGGSSTGANNNLLDLAGILSLDPAVRVRVIGNAAQFGPGDYSYLVATATGGVSGVNVTDQSRFDTSGFAGFGGGTFSLRGVGTELYLNFTPVPEPAAVLGVAGAGLAAAGWVRRRVVCRNSGCRRGGRRHVRPGGP